MTLSKSAIEIRTRTKTRIINKEISPILDRKIDDICAGLQDSYANSLRSLSIESNIVSIVNYIYALKTEINLALNYRRDLIRFLPRFSGYVNKNFKDVTRNDIISFLESLRKTETKDPMHKWIGTYNLYRIQAILQLQRHGRIIRNNCRTTIRNIKQSNEFY